MLVPLVRPEASLVAVDVDPVRVHIIEHVVSAIVLQHLGNLVAVARGVARGFIAARDRKKSALDVTKSTGIPLTFHRTVQ